MRAEGALCSRLELLLFLWTVAVTPRERTRLKCLVCASLVRAAALESFSPFKKQTPEITFLILLIRLSPLNAILELMLSL